MNLRAVLLLFAALTLPVSGQGLPDLGDASSASLSEQQEKTIGNRIMREVRTDPAYLDDPEVTDYIRSLGNRLLASSENPRTGLEFFMVNDEQINAFALVGGHIGIHTGLFALTQSEAELAGVVAHEIAHITQRHQARSIHGQRSSQWTSLAALALAVLASRSSSSQSGQITEAALASASALAIQSQLDYTREHEREADRVGLVTLERAGLDPRGMSAFFERMLRANRLAEFKSAPSYLRTHPLTIERIADMQDRIERMPSRLVPDSFDYRIARARVRASIGSATEAVKAANLQLEDKTVVRLREDVYQLAVAQRRAREFDAAWKTLAPLREGPGARQPAFELLAARLETDLGKQDDALATYKAALATSPNYRALVYGRLELLLDRGRPREVLSDLEERLRNVSDDWRLYEIQARAYEAVGNNVARHRAQAEAFYRRGNLGAAVDQLELASKQKGSNFYESSIVESRLRELRTLLETEREAEKAMKIS
ncbi:M48 family metalloprotease [Usitatibacter palustris]|uniref:M48 family metalloprotease n=1 Tax=Usitatibacter palustris TaxID=2732487 RepID=UPI0014891CE3|nr:M48 family metalloprotease [Usitatibacter palustris]